MKHRQANDTHYHYNAHRLDSVGYDDALTTIYHYDKYGRVDSLYDESGVVCYTYGNMGEVTNETRIYALPFLSQPIALTTQFTYDSWGRILNIIYPDHEVVRYHYDLGGQLCKIDNSAYYTYLDNVTYDRFGAKVSQEYGNGITTDYSYNNVTRRLMGITTTGNGTPLSQTQYAYDLVGNVTQVTSSCPWLPNHSFTESFSYDASDQLVSASETNSGSYQLAVSYGNWGKISSYDLTQTDLQSNVTTQDNRMFSYPDANSLQDAQTLFAPEQCSGTSDVAFTFGINGSLRKREVQGVVPHTEHYLFNSAANLKAYSNNGLDFAYYGYNASNTRAYKLSMLNMNQWVNGQPEPLDLQLQSAMFYPNAYINFNQNGEYTKHYYNGSERIASRLGSNTHPTDATSNDRLDYRMMCAEEIFRENIHELVSEGQPVDFQGTVELNSLQPVNATSDIFYYHTNHLGSTAFVTDNNATITQGFLYAPFGEITTEFNATFGNDIIPKYSFNAKELDEGSGMYYYEARYYNPPVFVSRDPLFEQKPWLTPYHYCSNNPVGRVDPTGMLDGDPDNPPGKKALTPQPQIVRQDNLASKPLPNTSYTSSPDAQGGDNSHPMATAGKETAGAYANASKAWNDYGKSHNGKQEQYKACYDASKKLKAKGVDVKTAQLKNGVNQAAKYSKVAEGVNLIIDGAKVYAAYKTDGEQIGIETSKAVGGTVGGWAGTWAGSETGLYLGSIGGPFGAALGAVVGGFVGGMFGNAVGKQSGIGIYTRINRNK